MSVPLQRASILWVDLSPTQGREQAGVRPAVVIASDGYLSSVPELVIVIPITTTDRSWPHHGRLEGTLVELPRPSFAMTEQPRRWLDPGLPAVPVSPVLQRWPRSINGCGTLPLSESES